MSAAKLLLVEDDPALSELLEYRFQNEGYDVRCTGDGDEAMMLEWPQVPFFWFEFERGGHGVFMLTRQQLLEYRHVFSAQA